MSNETEHVYDLSGVLGGEALSGVRPGTSILLSGPSMTGKDALLFEFLAHGVGRGESGIILTTEGRGEDALQKIESYTPDADPSLLAAIDCRARSGRETEYLDSGAVVYRVVDPSDLTGIGINITTHLDRIHSSNATACRMGLTSLSTMVRYSDRETIFKFCHVLLQRLESAGFIGLCTLNSEAHDDQTVQVLKQAFDANIEFREHDGDRQVRVLGIGSQPGEWQTLG